MGNKIAFMGVGAVGGYAGAHMAQAGEDVTFIDPWPAHVETMQRRRPEDQPHPRRAGIHREGARDARDRRAAARQGEADRHRLRLHEVVRHRVGDNADQRSIWRPDGFIVSLQNCMNEETIAGVVGWGKTVGCIASSITVDLCEPGHVRRAAGKSGGKHTVFRTGEVHGRITDRVKEICRLVGLADSAHGHRRTSGASAGRSW